MSEKQHQADLDSGLKHVDVPGDTEGGHCLNRHMGRAQNSCSHQWQGYKKAVVKKDLYNWDKYQNFGKQKQVVFRKAEEGEKGWEVASIDAPAKGDWDVDATCPRTKMVNFKEHCNSPYYHEAHHVVPNSTLNGVIQELFGTKKSVLRRFRKGLLDEGYNLNHMDNMILLPLERKIGAMLKLPCHRELHLRSHKVYSDQVKDKLTDKLSGTQEDIDKHKAPKYTSVKKKITNLSGTLYDDIVAAGAVGTLDDMKL